MHTPLFGGDGTHTPFSPTAPGCTTFSFDGVIGLEKFFSTGKERPFTVAVAAYACSTAWARGWSLASASVTFFFFFADGVEKNGPSADRF